MSDEMLVQKVIDGDSAALDELLERYYPKILKYCLFHLSSKEEAEDATQDVMIKAVRHIRSSSFSFRFCPYIYQIARNTCIDIYRKPKPDTVSLDSGDFLIPSPSYTTSSGINDEELIALVHSLPDDLSEVILLRYSQQLSLKEIAVITNVPLRTAQSRLNRAIKKRFNPEICVYEHTGKIHCEQSLKDGFLREGVVSIRSYESRYKNGIFKILIRDVLLLKIATFTTK